MRGLILAGGAGIRLAAEGVPEPKALVRIAGRPQLARLCDTLEALGCDTITCMVKAGVPAEDVTRRDARRRVLYCSTPSSLHTLALGLEAIPPGPVFCTMVDTVMPWDGWLAAWAAWQAASSDGVPAVLAVTHPSEREEQPLYVEMDQAHWITGIGLRTSGLAWCTAGVYGFGAQARSLAAWAVAEGVQRMRGFLGHLVLAGFRIRAIPVARALDVDHRADLDEANAWVPAVGP